MILVKHRNPLFVLFMTIVTLGIYTVYWMVSTTLELRQLGADAPHPALLFLVLVPGVQFFVIVYYLYKYTRAIDHVSWHAVPWWLLMVFGFVMPPVTVMLSQIELNKLG